MINAFDSTSDYGFTVVEMLHFLKGREYGVIEANYVSTLRPSCIEVVKPGSSITPDSKVWRVRIFLTRGDKIEKIEQEVYISLDGGYRDGGAVKNAMLTTQKRLLASSPGTAPYADLTLNAAVEKACAEPTLLDALSWIAVWESERVVRQAHHHFTTGERGPDGQGWDTCFRRCFEAVMKKYDGGSGEATEEGVVKRICDLKYMIKPMLLGSWKEYSPMADELNDTLNRFIAKWKLNTAPHMFAAMPRDEAVEHAQKQNLLVIDKDELEKDLEERAEDPRIQKMLDYYTSKPKGGAADHPSHYNTGDIETIDYIESLGMGRSFCAANVIKYVSRYKHKDGMQDLEKAVWYLYRLTYGEDPPARPSSSS